MNEGRNRGIYLNNLAYRYWRARLAVDVSGGGRIAVTFMEAD